MLEINHLKYGRQNLPDPIETVWTTNVVSHPSARRQGLKLHSLFFVVGKETSFIPFVLFFFVHTTKERKKRRRERLSSTSSMAVRFLWLGTTIYIYIRKDYNCTSKQTKIWPGPIDSLGSNYRTRFLLLLLEWAAVLLSVTYTIFQWNRATRATDSGGVATDLRPISIGPFWSLGWEWLRPSSVFNSCKT